MGLDTTHDCFHGSYTSFYRWRNELCGAAGISYPSAPRNRSADEHNGDWTETPDDIIYVLIDHSDCDGHILTEHCAPLADRLAGLLPEIFLLQSRETTELFIKGLRSAAAAGDMVIFG